jgi:hypothetical protein
MKKIALILALFFLVISAGISHAAWTKEITDIQEYQYPNGQRFFVIKLEVTSDASASGDITFSSQIVSDNPNHYRMQHMAGGVLYAVEYVPDDTDTPTTAPQVTLDTESGSNFFDETAGAAGTGEVFNGDVDAGVFVPITDLIFASTTLANTKKAIFYIWIKK